MKNVAATSGHSVSFADFVFVAEMMREGSEAGSDTLLNFYRRPPERSSLSALRGLVCWRAEIRSELASEEYKVCLRTQQKNAIP
ncbi:MAG TPA: hypothetical protein VMT51_11455 [Dongiaceae bacterium]|nr:hypothetical protein [Dongiaceae bacterium]